MIQDLTLRWVVTALFLLTAAECFVASCTGHRRWISVVGNILHVVMALAMLVMAWPCGAGLPTIPPMVFFLLATVWFGTISVSAAAAGHRIAYLYHAAMMLAMAWMYAVMNGTILAGHADDSAAPSMPSSHGHHQMPGMTMPGDTVSGVSSATPWWVDGLNWICTAGFAFATLYWMARSIGARRDSLQTRIGVLCQATMAAGMAIMFGVML